MEVLKNLGGQNGQRQWLGDVCNVAGIQFSVFSLPVHEMNAGFVIACSMLCIIVAWQFKKGNSNGL